jgi:hypothetical protein
MKRNRNSTNESQYIFFISCPQVQRGLRTLVASSDSFTTSISQQRFGFTHRYLSFLFIAMIAPLTQAPFTQEKLRWKEVPRRACAIRVLV